MNASSPSIDKLLKRVGWRILPLLTLLYFVAYLDRVNIGFAATGMQRDLHFSDALYGTGAGLFFVGALVAQLPATLLLARFGARRTLCALMMFWGAVSGSMAFLHTPALFLALRFLLGVAEAGFYPGVILYLTLWLPRRVRSSFTAWFLFAIPMASIFGGPLSSWILTHGRVGRFADWQMLLLCEAVPAVLLGALLPWLMTDTPEQAAWLSPEERNQLAAARATDEPVEAASKSAASTSALFQRGPLLQMLLFAAVYFAMQFALYAQSFWLPRILEDAHVPAAAVGWHVSIVYVVAAVGMLFWGRIADSAPAKHWTLVVPVLAAATGYAAVALTGYRGAPNVTLLMLAFGLGAAGALGATPPFWSHLTLGQQTTLVPAMIATVNVLGNLGGLAGPAVQGRLQQETGHFGAGMFAAAAGLGLSALLLVFRIPSQHSEEPTG